MFKVTPSSADPLDHVYKLLSCDWLLKYFCYHAGVYNKVAFECRPSNVSVLIGCAQAARSFFYSDSSPFELFCEGGECPALYKSLCSNLSYGTGLM